MEAPKVSLILCFKQLSLSDEWVFRSHSATHSVSIRPLIPVHSTTPFQTSGAVLFLTATLKLETSSRTSG